MSQKKRKNHGTISISQVSHNDESSQRCSLGSHNRKLRYRELLENLSTIEDDSNNNEECMERTADVVKQAQSLLDEVGAEAEQYPGSIAGEGYLDSKVLRATSDLAVRCSEQVSGNVNTYDRHELAAHIHANPEFWQFLFPREVPVYSYLYGTFAPTPPEQRVRAPRKQIERQKLAALQRPDNVDKLEKNEEGSVMVGIVEQFIKNKCRTSGEISLSYFHVVLDPTSFAATVENIYYVSFLVRDGLIAVHLDESSGLPFITPLSKEQSKSDQSNRIDENQFIVSINIKRWKELIQAFKIRKPMMVLNRT